MKVQNEVILNYLSVRLKTEYDIWPRMLILILEKTLQHSLNHLYEVFSDLNVTEMTWRILLKTQILMQKQARTVVSSTTPHPTPSPQEMLLLRPGPRVQEQGRVLTASLPR